MAQPRNRRSTWFKPRDPAPRHELTPEQVVARTADGVTLRIDRLPAKGQRRGVIVCLHAMMTDGRYFGARREGSFAATLQSAGYDVVVPDFRGHGRSVPPVAGPDDWSFDDLVELDLPAIMSAASAASGCGPRDMIVLGHSLGGLVTLAALGTGRLPSPRKLLLAATSVWLIGPQGPFARRALMTAYRGVTALFGKAPIRALRAGTADEAQTYIKQLTGWSTTARWTSLRGMDYEAALATIRTPIIPFVGARDWMCTVEDASQFARRLPSAAPLRVVGKAHGDPIDPDHFHVFTRHEMQPLWMELIARL